MSTGDLAWRGDGPAAAVASSLLECSAEPDRPAGRAFLLRLAPFPMPSATEAGQRGSVGAPRPFAGGPAAWPVACSPRCTQGLGGRGPESSARSPRANPRAHTLPPVACLTPAIVTDTESACARVCVVPLPSPHPLLFSDAAQAAVGFRGPSGLGFWRGPEGSSYEISACLEAAGNGLRRHARLPTSGK